MNNVLGRAVGWGAALLLLLECTPYPIAKQYRKEAARDLIVPMVQAHPKTYAGTVVIWGGSIIDVVNDSGGSEVTVLETPLDADGYPAPSSYSRGRFKARVDGFLDPLIFKKGVRVTVAGKVAGIEKEKLGGVLYAYPMLDILQLRYWQYVPAGYDYYYYSPWPYYYSPRYGWYGWPYYDGVDFFFGFPYGHRGGREFHDFHGGHGGGVGHGGHGR